MYVDMIRTCVPSRVPFASSEPNPRHLGLYLMKTSDASETPGSHQSGVQSGDEHTISNAEPSNDEESSQSRAEDINSGKNPAWEGSEIIKSLAVNWLKHNVAIYLVTNG